jgi:4a-hydroxytetrahydrobiopterin dehydratase
MKSATRAAAYFAMIPVGFSASDEGGGRVSETITPQRFHEVDWRVVRSDACAHFRTGSFAAGVALVDAIGTLAEAANHHPDVDLRSDGVTVRL